MRKLLTIVLLTIVSSIKCTSMAQEVYDDEKQKIIDYINCFYTAKYVLNDSVIPEEEKQIIKEKGIDTVSVENAYKYAELDTILRNNGLEKTAEKLTKELDVRNYGVKEYVDIYDFVDKVVDIAGFEKFKLSKEVECVARNRILRWYSSQRDKNNYSRDDELGNKDESGFPTKDEVPFDSGIIWISIALLILLCIICIAKIIKLRKEQDNGDCNNNQLSKGMDGAKNEGLKDKNRKLKDKNRELEDEIKRLEDEIKKLEKENNKSVEATVINTQNVTETEAYLQNKIEKPTTVAPTIVYYADIDVIDNVFARTYKEDTRISVYKIDVNRQTFVPVENKQLYEKLSMVNSTGILDACDVKGNYQNGKAIYITPGRTQQEENGKWRIVNKAIIEIK